MNRAERPSGPKRNGTKTYVKFRHRIYFPLLRPVVRVWSWKYHFKTKKVKLDKKQNYLILSNHQSFLDPALICLTIRRPIYFVTSDAIFSNKWYIRFLFHAFGPIKTRKGSVDISCIRTVVTAATACSPAGGRASARGSTRAASVKFSPWNSSPP